MKCYEKCALLGERCQQKSCRMWIDYKEDLNCTTIAIEKNGNMTLREVAERLKLSFVRIKQIEDVATEKMYDLIKHL